MQRNNSIAFILIILVIALAFASIYTGNRFIIDAALMAMAVLGCKISYDLITDAHFSNLSKQWPTCSSHIENSQVIYSRGDNDSPPYYTVRFKISYTVSGQYYRYEFKNPNPKQYSHKHEAEAFLKLVEQGKAFSKIHYNPVRAEQSYLEPGFKIHHILGIPIGLAIMVIPLLTLTGLIQW